MKPFNIYNLHENLIFRTPLIPLQKQQISYSEFFEISKQPFFKEAIYLASPVLYDELSKWHKNEIQTEKEKEKLVISLYKYYSRMQSRCTPFGLFAACAVASWQDKSNIVFDDIIKRHTRLDMNYLCSFAQHLISHPLISSQLLFYPNNSIYTFANTLRYVEYNYVNNRRIHQITSVDNNDYLQIILEGASKGASIKTLTDLLTNCYITLKNEKKESSNKKNKSIYQVLKELEFVIKSEDGRITKCCCKKIKRKVL